MYKTLRPLIFRMSPEDAHRATLVLLRLAGGTLPGRLAMKLLFSPQAPGPEVFAFGLKFPNPLGMAAGYDKDGLGWRGLASLGFGHIELGTVTLRPQSGNAKPRVFRLVQDQAVINRMGFPNRGAAFMAHRLNRDRPGGVVLGVSIGKNKTTPMQEAAEDYLSLLRRFAPLADYLVINISSPNTPGLRSLHNYNALYNLLMPLALERAELQKRSGKRIPMLVKLSPDLTQNELDDSLSVILTTGMDGVIASNTSTDRSRLKSPRMEESGGLSGAPIRKGNTSVIHYIASQVGNRLPVVASGGVMAPLDAREKLDAGAVLVQLFTGLIYAGPGLVKQILDSGVLAWKRPILQPEVAPALPVEIPIE